MLQRPNTDISLLNVRCWSKKVCFIHTSLPRGQFREPVALHLCSSETALSFNVDLQASRWAHKLLQTHCFWGEWGDETWTLWCQSKRTSQAQRAKTKKAMSTLLPWSGRHQHHHVRCAKRTKKTETWLSSLNAIVPFCHDHSHDLC